MTRYLLIGLAFLMTLGACSEAPRPTPNILLIVVDALRADRLGCYGSKRGLTPFLDEMASRATVFHNAYAQAPWTKPSIASLLTSRYKSQHGVTSLRSVLAEKESTLAELLRERGYSTAGFSANVLLNRGAGFAQGYEVYRALPPGEGRDLTRPPPRADALNRLALEWLAALPSGDRSPFFLHLHYMEPHTPYFPPQWALDELFSGREMPDLESVNRYAIASAFVPLENSQLDEMIRLYDAEVLSLDRDLGLLFEALEERGLLRNTLILITADHGEEFKDHGFVGHGKTLYSEVIRVPLLALVPGQRTRVDVHEVVSLIDVTPTLLDWLGEPAPASLEGRSFRSLLLRGQGGWLGRLWHLYRPGSRSPDLAYSELIRDKHRDTSRYSHHELAVIGESQKLIAGTDGERELYDLSRDAAERQPRTVHSKAGERLEKALGDFKMHMKERPAEQTLRQLDPKTKEQMRALGYVDE